MPSPVSIVIPTWNGKHLLEQFLPSVISAADAYVRSARAAVEIVVVDDGSTDDTAGWLSKQSAPVPLRTIRQDPNRGFGAACNRGVQDARHPLVYLVNNDVEMSTNVLSLLSGSFDADDDSHPLLAVHTRMRDLETNRDVGTGKMGGFHRGFLRVHRSYMPRDDTSGPYWSMFATGGSSMFHRARYLELGGFDPLFAPFYFEDVELSYRGWKRGYSVAYQPHSLVRHRFSSTIAPLAGKSVERISHRNRLIFHWIHLHDSRFLAAHVLWLTVLALTAPLTFKFRFLLGLGDALTTFPGIHDRRRAERSLAKRTDREVLRVFEELEARGEVRPYDDPRELAHEQ